MAVGGALLQPSHGCCVQLLLLLGLGTLSRSTATLCPHPTKMLAVLLGSHSQWVLNVQVMLPDLAEDARVVPRAGAAGSRGLHKFLVFATEMASP